MSRIAVQSSWRRHLPVVVAAGLLSVGAIAGPARAAVAQSLGPATLTDAPAHVTTRAATLRGSVTPGAATASYDFQFGLTFAYGISTSAASLGPSNLATTVSARVFGLRAGTIYHYRLVAASADGTSYGEDRTFITTPASPQRITVQVTPNGGSPPTYRYAVAGALILPPRVNSQDGCHGYVSVEVAHGRRPLVIQWAAINDQCRYRASVSVPAGGLRGRGTVAVRVRFLGSRVLAAQVAAPVIMAVG